MAHFSKLGIGNKVEQVIVVSNDIATTEEAGIEFLHNLYNNRATYKQTSYNTHGGVHLSGGTPFRKNYGSIGYTYDQTLDAFIPPQNHPSWTLNKTTCLWEAPTPRPEDGNDYLWNEETKSWELVEY
tara:strand:+ start:739 stop:1119 length:381 start_codon:yes stop_codon:yes gene_type:complete